VTQAIDSPRSGGPIAPPPFGRGGGEGVWKRQRVGHTSRLDRLPGRPHPSPPPVGEGVIWRQRGTLALFVLFVAAGCAVHRPAVIEPVAPLPGAFAEAQAGAEAGEPHGRWWQAFGDDRLDALLSEAVAHNLDLAQGVARLEAAQAAARASSAGLFPTLDLRASGNRKSSPGFLGTDTGNSYSLSAAAGYEVDLWRRVRSGRDAARLAAQASAEDLHTLYLALSAQVADLYYLAAEQRAQLALTDRTIAAFADATARVEDRYRHGLVPALDLYQARQNVAAARARRPPIEANLNRAEHGLAVLLGYYPGAADVGGLAELPPVPGQFPTGLPATLLTRRPDLRAALRRVEASDAEVAVAVANRFPALNLLANYGRSSTAFATGAITGTFWNVGADLLAPLVDGGRRRAEVARSEAELRASLAAYQQAVLAAVQEVEDALSDNRATEKEIARLDESVAATSATLDNAWDRYLQGLAEFLPVLTAQQAHFDAESRLLTARRRLISHRITLARALGGDWMAAAAQEGLAKTEGS
jgi:NodT family efflux transporter outer membrane factor (OMF) lipoprotein